MVKHRIKEWIRPCSERPSAICTIIVNACLCQGSGIWPKCDITRGQLTTGEGFCIVCITEKLAHQHEQNATFGLFRLTTWFHIHLFLFIQDSSKANETHIYVRQFGFL